MPSAFGGLSGWVSPAIEFWTPPDTSPRTPIPRNQGHLEGMSSRTLTVMIFALAELSAFELVAGNTSLAFLLTEKLCGIEIWKFLTTPFKRELDRP